MSGDAIGMLQIPMGALPFPDSPHYVYILFINNKGQNVELNQFAEITQVMGASALERMDRVPSIKVQANVVGHAPAEQSAKK